MPDNRFSKQDIDNQGADRSFNGFPMRENVLYDGSVLRRQKSDVNGNAISVSGLSLLPFDYVIRELTNSTTETYTFKSGGASGAVTNTVIIVYTDDTLNTISTVTKT